MLQFPQGESSQICKNISIQIINQNCFPLDPVCAIRLAFEEA